MEHIFKLQEFCNSMVKLCIDGYEYAYLKAIVLFSPGTEIPLLCLQHGYEYAYLKAIEKHVFCVLFIIYLVIFVLFR